MKFVEGQTQAGTHVKVRPDDNGSFGYIVEVDGKRRKVRRVSVARDGGTTTLYLENDSTIVFPRKINDPDRTPKLDGADIVEALASLETEPANAIAEAYRGGLIMNKFTVEEARHLAYGIRERLDPEREKYGRLFDQDAREDDLARTILDLCGYVEEQDERIRELKVKKANAERRRR